MRPIRREEEVTVHERSASVCESQEAGAKKSLVGQVPRARRSLTVNLRLRKVKGGEVGRKVGQGKSAVVTSKMGGEDMGGPYPGAVLGWLSGSSGRLVGSRGFRGEQPHVPPPTVPQTHPSCSPQANATSLIHMPQVQCPGKGEGFRQGCLLPFCFSLSGQDKVGKGVFPSPQQSGSGQPPRG